MRVTATGMTARADWDPRMAELDRLIAVEDGKAAAERVSPRVELAALATEAMLLAKERRAAGAEQRAMEAEARAQRSGEVLEQALARVGEQELVIAELREEVGRLTKEVGEAAARPWSRRCFVCGAVGWCEHREAELAEGPPVGRVPA